MAIMLGIYCRTSVEKSVSGVATIIQQEEAGIKFADSMGWDYKVYKDEGKSGYKVEDEDNPFKDRDGFQQLLEDIKSKIVTDVWVIENSRLSRNSTTQAIIYRLFEKNKITIYENGRKYDLNNPTDKLTKQILDAVSEFERYEIVFRTNRGYQKAVDSGKMQYRDMYGYTLENGVTTPIPEQLEKIKKAFRLFIDENKSIETIGKLLVENTSMTNLSLNRKTRRILSHHEYTGYCLNVAGRKIKKNYESGEIDNLNELKNQEYWVKSKWYNVPIISIEDWIKSFTKIEKHRKESNLKNNEIKKTRETDKSLCSGLYTCRYCGNTFYFSLRLSKTTATYGRRYRHWRTAVKCKQEPQSIMADTLESITDVYVFISLIFLNNPEVNNQIIDNSIAQIAIIQNEVNKLKSDLDKADKIKIKFEENLLEETDKTAQKFIINALTRKTNEIEKIEKSIDDKLEEINKLEKNIDKLTDTTTPIDKLKQYFNFRNNADFKGARFFIQDEVLNPYNSNVSYSPSIYKNQVQFYRYHFNLNCNYNIIYPFISKVLNMELNFVNYKDIEVNWIKNNSTIIEDFNNLMQNYLKNRNKEKELELLELIFNVDKDLTHLSLSTPDILASFKTTKEVSELLNVKYDSLIAWGRNNNVFRSSTDSNRKKCMLWDEAAIEKYKKSSFLLRKKK